MIQRYPFDKESDRNSHMSYKFPVSNHEQQKDGSNDNGAVGDEHRGGSLRLGRSDSSIIGDISVSLHDMSMHMVVLGESGFGKTTFVTNLLTQIWEIDPTFPWLVFDLKGEYLHHLPDIRHLIVLKPSLNRIEVYHRRLDANESNVSIVTYMPLRVDLLTFRSSPPTGGGRGSIVGRVFNVLRESLASTFRESSDLSPLMEKILWESLDRVYNSPHGTGGFFDLLLRKIEAYVDSREGSREDIVKSSQALVNRIERFRRSYLGDILNSRAKVSLSTLTKAKVIIDLSECVSQGSTEDLRLLLNLIMEKVFEEAVKRGLSQANRATHITVIEDANLLVPEVLHRRTMGDVTAVEEMFLIARAYGEGFILVAQRPTLSSFTLSNAGIKVVFRTPYDARKIGEMLGINEMSQQALKSLRKFEAIITTIDCGPHKVTAFGYKDTERRSLRLQLVLPEEQTPSKLQPRSPALHRTPPTIESLSPSSSSLAVPTSTASVEHVHSSNCGELDYDDEPNQHGANDEGQHDRDNPASNINTSNDNNVNRQHSACDSNGMIVEERDLCRLLKRGLSSDKIRLFKTIATSPESKISRSDAVQIVFGGREWKYMDSIRSLTKKTLWRRQILALEEDGTMLKLTQYGRELWNLIQPLMATTQLRYQALRRLSRRGVCDDRRQESRGDAIREKPSVI
nr:DUF87 domain-containing protein [Candidatus Njordarchaeota archaeon]